MRVRDHHVIRRYRPAAPCPVGRVVPAVVGAVACPGFRRGETGVGKRVRAGRRVAGIVQGRDGDFVRARVELDGWRDQLSFEGTVPLPPRLLDQKIRSTLSPSVAVPASETAWLLTVDEPPLAGPVIFTVGAAASRWMTTLAAVRLEPSDAAAATSTPFSKAYSAPVASRPAGVGCPSIWQMSMKCSRLPPRSGTGPFLGELLRCHDRPCENGRCRSLEGSTAMGCGPHAGA